MLERARRLLRRLGWMTTGGTLALLLGSLLVVGAQQPTIGVFSRIYLGGTASTNPQIRWGAPVPSGVCSPGSFYLQNTGPVWFCLASSTWRQVANTTQIGFDFYAAAPTFGAVCDGVADDTVAIQGAVDAANNLGHSGHVILPVGICNVSSIVVGSITEPWFVSPNDPLHEVGCVVSFTSGDNTHFTIDSGCTLDPDHVGKSFTFNIPLIQSTIAFDGSAHLQDGPGSFAHWFKYYNAIITGVTNPTHGTMTITGLRTGGSLDTRQFPDLPHAANCVNLPSGVPGTGCTSSYWCHQHSHLLANCGPDANSAVIDALVDLPALATYQMSNGGQGELFPYIVPSDTNTRFISIAGASQATTGLRFTGNPTGKPALLFSRNKYFTIEDFSVFSAATAADPVTVALAGAGAGNVDNGQHSYRLSCTADGNNLNGPMSGEQNVTVTDKTVNGKVAVSGIEVCPSTKNLYRSKAGQASTGPWYLVTNLAGATTTYQDNTADASLGTGASTLGDTIGIYMGGLPGGGTQTLAFTARHIGIQGFHQCLLLGDNLGGEMSDATFNQIAVTSCDYGVVMAPGSPNTLDVTLNELQGGFNKVAVWSTDGNLLVNWGSFSFNAVDFLSSGFGPLRIENMRTEGPGLVFYGDEPGVTLRNINMAEPQAARTLVGDVTATPDNVRSVDINITSIVCPLNICPVSFGSGDLTDLDLRKTIVLPGKAPDGDDLIALFNGTTSATTGTIWVQNRTAAATGNVTSTIYDTNTVDLTWPTGQIYASDTGGAVILPEASVTHAWNGRAVRVSITSFLTATTGKGFFYLGGNGGGPVKPAGGTATNPNLLWHTAIYFTGVEIPGATIEQLNMANGMVKLDPGSNGVGWISIRDSKVWSATDSALTAIVPGPRYTPTSSGIGGLNVWDLPTPTSNLNLGMVFPIWKLTDDTNQASRGLITVQQSGNHSQYFAGPTTYLTDGVLALNHNVPQWLVRQPKPTAGFNTTAPTPYLTDYPSQPVGPWNRMSGLKQLSEGQGSDGANLRLLCTFATSDTSTCTFQRNETYTFNSNGTGGTTSDVVTSTYRVLVTSGHFSQMDVGKIIKFPACCADGSVFDKYALIVANVDATHIDTRDSVGNVGGFPNGTSTGTAVVGQNEPDALWRPALWGCSGLDTASNEVVTITSWTANQVVLTSSNATSTASCLVGVIR